MENVGLQTAKAATARRDKSLQNPSQLLLRHIDEFRGSSILVVGYLDDGFGLLLQQYLKDSPISFFNFDYSAHRHLSESLTAAGLQTRRVTCGSWYQPPADAHDVAIVYLPKSRGLIELTLTMLAGALATGAKVFLVGENNSGIRSSRPTLETIIGNVTSSDAARHSVLYRSTRGATSLPARPQLNDWVENFTVEVRGLTLELRSLPGVFSHGRLDDGTRFFLEALQVPNGARVLDFGCGSGVIGLVVKRLWPSTVVDMVDTNALAVESARLTMQANNLPKERVWQSDVFSDVKDSYTRILSNPPFHIGVRTDYRVVEAFLDRSAKHLEKLGALTIVANRFLKYPPLIEKSLGHCRIVAESKTFRVYEGFK